MNKIREILSVACFATCAINAPLMAQSSWDGGVGNYATGGNWTPSGVPSSATEILIESGTAIFTGTDTFFERAASSTIDGGTLEINNARFVNARGGPATFNLVDGGLTQNNSTYFIVGQNNFGTFNQSGGLADITVGRGFFVTDGAGLGGAYNLTGGTLDLKMNQFGADSLTNGLFNAWVGRGGNNDSMLVDGGTFNLAVTGPVGADRNFLVARNATFQVDSGSVEMVGLRSFVVGMGRVANTSSNMIINGGNTSIEASSGFYVGAGVSGTLEMTAGNLSLTGAAGLRMGDQAASTSISTDATSALTTSAVTLSGGVMDVEGDIILAINSFNTSEFSMSGGSLFANDIFVGSGSATFNFFGGQIQLAGDRTDILTETWFVGAAGTSATYDSTGDRTVIAIPEPNAALLGLVGALLLATKRSRRISPSKVGAGS
ncbi:MAG: hypothetical protein ACFCU4_00085 [Puniceicoccaceae bacterium]